MRTSLILSTIFILLFGCQNDCEVEQNQDEFYVALPSPPVKVDNTSGSWLVYELHIKSSDISKVGIYNNNELLLTYDKFLTREDMHIASIWLPYPSQGWTDTELKHTFQMSTCDGNAHTQHFNLPIQASYPDPVIIDFPLQEGVWLAEAAPGPDSYHTRAIFAYPTPRFDEQQQAYLFGNNPQRYAIDYALLVDGLPYVNDGSSLSDWYCYNTPIYAVQDGTVIFTEDQIPDNQTPFSLDYETDTSNASGNVVYLQHQDGNISVYCHMIPNSLLVEVGENVTAGQELGRLGNSGNSFAPHLHMHLLTNPENKEIINYEDGLFMESIPYRFDHFSQLGNVPTGWLEPENLYPFQPTENSSYQNVLPSENDVILR